MAEDSIGSINWHTASCEPVFLRVIRSLWLVPSRLLCCCFSTTSLRAKPSAILKSRKPQDFVSATLPLWSIKYECFANCSIADPELKRTLQSLACAKYRVLSKKPKGKDIDPTDVFAYNTNFSDAKMRIKINQIQLKETKEENKTTHERVAADRHYETQAAIVRIMKSRKIITHAELVAEVIKATRSRGVLEPAEIKKNIEKYDTACIYPHLKGTVTDFLYSID